MSFPSDPVSNNISAVFTNAGIDQVVGYDAMSKGSPWSVATKDSATGYSQVDCHQSQLVMVTGYTLLNSLVNQLL